MAQGFFSRLLRQRGSQSTLSRGVRRARRTARRGTGLGVEQLEGRIVLSADPLLSVVADQFVDEGTPLNISDLGTFTDVVEGTIGGGDAIGLDPTDFSSLGAFNPLTSVTIDTDALTISGGFSGTGAFVSADTGFGAFQIAVFTFDSFTLGAGLTISTTGTRPLALLSQSDMTIAGTIDVSGRSDFSIDDPGINAERIAGPGGGNGGLGNFTGTAYMGAPAAGAPSDSVGSPTISGLNAGGGTGGGMGGDGGRADTAAGGPLIGPEGMAFASVATLSIGVQGGSGGASSGSGIGGTFAGGGGGGGGIELGAVGALTVASTGQVLANGGDALSPGVASHSSIGGGGGGAGGGIVIHATSVNQFGVLSANGGNGGFAPRDGGGGGGGAILIAYSDTGAFDHTGGVESVIGGLNSPATGGENGDVGFVAIVEEAPSATPIIESFDFIIDWGDSSTPDTGAATIDMPGVSIGDVVAGSFDGSHTYTDNGVYVVMVTINDDNGGGDVQTFVVTVANVAPTAILANSGPVDEGGSTSVSFSGQFDPSAADTTAGFRYAYDFDNNGSWDLGDGSYAGSSVGGASAVVPAIFLADGPASVTVKARILDDDDGFTDYTTVIDVNNVAPSVAADNAAVTVNEGDTATNTGTYDDPGIDMVSLIASVGLIIDNGDGTWSWSYGPADGPDDSVLVTITATDSDGDSSDTTFQLTVNNVAPAVAADNAVVTVNEGDTATNAGTYDDPGADTVSLIASVGLIIDNGDGTWSWSYGTADGPDDSVLVTITATDSDGDSSDTTFQVTVNNVAPTADAGGPYTTFIDTPITLNGSGSDVPADVLSFEWFLGAVEDGILFSMDASATFDPEALGIVVTSTVTVTLRVTDDDGDFTLATAQVNVLGPGTWLVDGTLYVIGTDQNDIVAITHQSGNLKVAATFQNSNSQLYSLASVSAIDVRLRGGDDVVVITNHVTLPTTIDGGSGNDVLTAGGGDTVIYGGLGNDVLSGGPGNNVLIGGDGRDVIVGRSGRDLIIGGFGSDVLSGGSGEDILVGGWTIYDDNTAANRAAIDSIMAVWTSSATFDARVATLMGDGGLLEAGEVVFDDDESDVLVGGGGRDLLFADANLWDGTIDLVAYNWLQDVLVPVN